MTLPSPHVFRIPNLSGDFSVALTPAGTPSGSMPEALMVASLILQHLMCAGLWCLVEGDTSCKTKLDPPLDGTECGADKVTPSIQHSASRLTSPGH